MLGEDLPAITNDFLFHLLVTTRLKAAYAQLLLTLVFFLCVSFRVGRRVVTMEEVISLFFALKHLLSCSLGTNMERR